MSKTVVFSAVCEGKDVLARTVVERGETEWENLLHCVLKATHAEYGQTTSEKVRENIVQELSSQILKNKLDVDRLVHVLGAFYEGNTKSKSGRLMEKTLFDSTEKEEYYEFVKELLPLKMLKSVVRSEKDTAMILERLKTVLKRELGIDETEEFSEKV